MAKKKESQQKNNEHLFMRSSPVVLVFEITGIILFLAITLALISLFFLLLSPYTPDDSTTPSTLLSISVGLVLCLNFIFIAAAVLSWFNRYYIVSKNKVAVHVGTFFSRRREYKLEDIKSLGLRQTFIGKFFNFGTIRIFNPIINEDVMLRSINNPQKVLKYLQSATGSDNTSSRRIIPM